MLTSLCHRRFLLTKSSLSVGCVRCWSCLNWVGKPLPIQTWLTWGLCLLGLWSLLMVILDIFALICSFALSSILTFEQRQVNILGVLKRVRHSKLTIILKLVHYNIAISWDMINTICVMFQSHMSKATKVMNARGVTGQARLVW